MSRDRTTIAPQIIDEASDWFISMRDPSVSAEHREAFAEWLRASPVHVGAYFEIARLWTDASHIDPELAVDSAADQPLNVVPLREGGDSSRQHGAHSSIAGNSAPSAPLPAADRMPAQQRGVRSSRFALAASIVAVSIALTSAWLYLSRAPSYVTDFGEQRVLTLDDGSTVRLNSRSKLTVRMSPELRQVDLVHGQALFEVAHDAARAFIVTSGGVAIRAVGTQFDVNQRQSGTVVTVVEGRVRVGAAPEAGLSQFFSTRTAAHKAQEEPAPSLSPGATFLSAGEQARIAKTGAIERTATPNTAAAISWLQQELVFDGQSLADVLEEFNRYTRVPIVLSDASLGDLRVNAVFHTTNPDSLLRFVSRFDGVQVERSEKEIRISKRR